MDVVGREVEGRRAVRSRLPAFFHPPIVPASAKTTRTPPPPPPAPSLSIICSFLTTTITTEKDPNRMGEGAMREEKERPIEWQQRRTGRKAPLCDGSDLNSPRSAGIGEEKEGHYDIYSPLLES